MLTADSGKGPTMNMLMSAFLEILKRDGRLPPSSPINTATRKDVNHGQEEEGQGRLLIGKALAFPRDSRRLPRRMDWEHGA